LFLIIVPPPRLFCSDDNGLLCRFSVGEIARQTGVQTL
jgi:hypothetical protein